MSKQLTAGARTASDEPPATVESAPDDDREVVATIVHMLHSGEVRLCGNFRGAAVSDFD